MQHYTPSQRRFFCILSLSLSMMIAGCQGTGETIESNILPESNNIEYNWVNIESPEQKDALTQLIPQIRSSYALNSPQKDTNLLELAKQIDALNDPQIEVQRKNNWLYNTLLGIDSDQLDDIDFISYLNLARDSFSIRDSQKLLFELLTNPRVNQLIDQLSIDDQIKTHQQAAQVFQAQGNTIDSLRQLMVLQTLLTEASAIAENNELIWQTVNQFDESSLNELADLEFDRSLAAWYRLAAVNKTHANNLELRHKATNDWIAQNPSHPGAQALPIDLELIQLLLEERPTQIALLLPLKGKLASVGKAIMDGFFTAYYKHLGTRGMPEVVFFDTSENNVIELYEKAVGQGADLIIGPLSKTNVSALENHKLSVPTIALNYTRGFDAPINPLNFYLYQFGLSLEDEARQVAQHAIDEGKKYAMVIAADDDWSYRTAEAFSREWSQLGGVIVARNSFSKKDDLSKTTKQILNVATSENRARQLKQLFGENLEFEPRRRGDIDMIFLVARSKVAQQIKPILAFHYAGDVPVFATSQLYSSIEDESKNRDLSGITISTLPWATEDSELKANLLKSLPASPNLERLYAMGADIWLLHDRLHILNWSGAQSIDGNTGKLFLAKNKRIYRKQPFAQIVKGRVELIPELLQIEPEKINQEGNQ